MTQSPAIALAFYGFALLAILGAAAVALLQNIVRSAFALLAAFVGVAGLYALLSADLVAVIQLMVYVGGVLVVMLFAVMLTARIDQVNVSNRSLGVVPAAALLLPVTGVLAAAAFALKAGGKPLVEGPATTASIGQALLGAYVLPFEAISVLLVAALLGAVVLSRGWGSLTRLRTVEASAKGAAPNADGDGTAAKPRRALPVVRGATRPTPSDAAPNDAAPADAAPNDAAPNDAAPTDAAPNDAAPADAAPNDAAPNDAAPSAPDAPAEATGAPAEAAAPETTSAAPAAETASPAADGDQEEVKS